MKHLRLIALLVGLLPGMALAAGTNKVTTDVFIVTNAGATAKIVLNGVDIRPLIDSKLAHTGGNATGIRILTSMEITNVPVVYMRRPTVLTQSEIQYTTPGFPYWAHGMDYVDGHGDYVVAYVLGQGDIIRCSTNGYTAIGAGVGEVALQGVLVRMDAQTNNVPALQLVQQTNGVAQLQLRNEKPGSAQVIVDYGAVKMVLDAAGNGGTDLTWTNSGTGRIYSKSVGSANFWPADDGSAGVTWKGDTEAFGVGTDSPAVAGGTHLYHPTSHSTLRVESGAAGFLANVELKNTAGGWKFNSHGTAGLEIIELNNNVAAIAIHPTTLAVTVASNLTMGAKAPINATGTAVNISSNNATFARGSLSPVVNTGFGNLPYRAVLSGNIELLNSAASAGIFTWTTGDTNEIGQITKGATAANEEHFVTLYLQPNESVMVSNLVASSVASLTDWTSAPH